MVVSDNDASDAGGEKDPEKEPKSPSRPVTAAARRERRASASGDAKADADKTRPAGKAKDAKDRPTPKRDRKEKKASVFSRLVRFIREVWAELRKVIWPTQKQMITYTTVVLVFVVFMVALVSGLDLAFGKVIEVVFGA
ncbi:preprotein translocase subunit SecE [Amycolatopsis sp.]|uniref:preprotein translocase subunit SecE n=1 Tax=Amycolatopsis sp. TaxID=37632 RepID=UPI002E0CC497|nr:preprotein translocase subunit SecE [Amycolatopsis sp.]